MPKTEGVPSGSTEGNANDTPQLHSLVNEVIQNTGIVPESVSTDDGYASTDGRNKVLSLVEVKNVSISGSKGKALTPVEDWAFCSIRDKGWVVRHPDGGVYPLNALSGKMT